MHETLKNCFRGRAFAFLIIFLLVPSLTLGADSNSATAEQEVPETARQRLKTRVTYSCVDSPIEKVLMDLAEQAKIDIVKSPKVTGNVTVKVTNVPLEEALTNILAAHDYTYVATESMIRVVLLPEITVAIEQPITRIYQITYADANEVAEALRTFVSRQGNVALNKGTSHIMVTDIESKIKGIDKFIEQIDHLTAQVLVEVRIYDITSKEGFELSPDWYVGRSVPITPNIVFPTETRTIVTDPYGTDYSETTEGYYRDADDGPGSMTVTGWTEDGGITQTETRVTELPPITNRRRKPFVGDPVGGSFDRITGGTLSVSLLDIDLDFMLSILHQQVEAELLANPRILVLDNETANFEIVRQIPYRELLQVAREDPITYTEFKDVGVQLKVTPHIARDGMIRLHIVPEFGVLVAQDALRASTGWDFYQDALGVPTVDTRRADTTAMIKDGQTIVIGGLRKRETSRDITKVPLLADLPFIGGLFRSETESVEVNELVVFITTTIVTEPELSDLEKKQFSQTEFASPEMTKLRLESDHEAKADSNEFSITEALDLLLQELEPSGK